MTLLEIILAVILLPLALVAGLFIVCFTFGCIKAVFNYFYKKLLKFNEQK